MRETAILLSFVCALPAAASTVEIGPGADLRAAVAALTAGDELVLRGGTYSFDKGFRVKAAGTATQPIVIRGKLGENALIQMTTPDHNVVEVYASHYLVLRNLHFRGGSTGIRLMESDYVTIEDSEVYDTGDVAISANSGGTYLGLVIRRNHIHHTSGTGEGLYLGCSKNACRVLDSLIESNYIHNTNGPTVEQGDGIEIKEGSAGNVIRNNVIHDTNYPGIITYGTVGNGAPNIIEGNVIWNTNEFAIQSAADAVIRNNIVLGTIGLQHHDGASPSNHTIVHNTIIAQDNGIEVRNVSGAVVIANNAIYSSRGNAIQLISGNVGLVSLAGNVGLGGLSGGDTGYKNGSGLAADVIAARFDWTPPLDLFPKAGGALVGAGSTKYVTAVDFNGTPRDGVADAGAYKFQPGGNPGWVVSPGFKVSVGDVSGLPQH